MWNRLYNTAISVTNPAYGDEMAAGGLTFTFYGMGGVVATYDTTVDPIVGVGLEDDGTLSPGGTYQVLASEILAATDWGETFQGHVHLRADYTNCSGLGWVTDFMRGQPSLFCGRDRCRYRYRSRVDLANCLIIRSTKQTAPVKGGRLLS